MGGEALAEAVQLQHDPGPIPLPRRNKIPRLELNLGLLRLQSPQSYRIQQRYQRSKMERTRTKSLLRRSKDPPQTHCRWNFADTWENIQLTLPKISVLYTSPRNLRSVQRTATQHEERRAPIALRIARGSSRRIKSRQEASTPSNQCWSKEQRGT